MFEKSINSLANIKAKIAEFKRLDANISIDERNKLLNILMVGYISTTKAMGSFYAFRVRKNKPGENYLRVSRLWYPSENDVNAQGRVNRVGRSFLYISASADLAVLEKRPEVGDILTVLRVKLKDFSQRPHVMELGVAETSSQYGINNGFNLIEETNHRVLFSDNEELQKNILIRDFLAKEFMKIVTKENEHEFSTTIAIAEHLIKSNKMHGLVYPSIAGDGSRKGGGMNMAIKPKSADKLFMADHAWTLLVEGLHGTYGYKMRCLEHAKSISNGDIKWS